MKIRVHRYKYQFAPAEKKLIAVYLILGFIYAVISVYLLSTPIEDWVFNLGQYNQSILESFPKAQYWVNVSIAFREKVIPLYLLYQVFFWFVFVTTTISCVAHWRHYLVNTNISKISPICTKRKTLVLALLFFIVMLVAATIVTINSGGELYKASYQDLKPGPYGEYIQWNVLYGFVLYKILTMLAMGGIVLGFFINMYSNIICFTNLFNQQEKGG